MWRDLIHGLQILRANRSFAAAVTFTLALAIGANTAIFSAVHAVLLRPLPYRDADRLVAIWGRHAKQTGLSKVFDTQADFLRWRESAHSFSAMATATWGRGGEVLTGRGATRSVLSIPVSAEFFPLLGASAAMGRVFGAADLARGCSVVLAHRFWRDALGGDPSIAGQSLALGGTLGARSCTVTGVMPESFVFYPAGTDLWTLAPADRAPESAAGVFARLRDGVTIAAAETELLALHERDKTRLARDRVDIVPAVYPLRDEFTWLTSRSLRSTLFALFGAVGALLASACANIASLLAGRYMARQREMAIRAALGSGSRRLILQLVAEGLVLAAPGALGGVALAAIGLQLFRTARPVELPPGASLDLSWPVLGFSAILTMGAAVGFSLLPAWRASRADLERILRGSSFGSPGRRRVGSVLVAVQVALSLALCAAAGLLVESIVRLHRTPPGFDLDKLAWFSVSGTSRTLEQIAERVAAVPGVESVALTSHLPLTGFPSQPVTVEGRDNADPPSVSLEQRVSANYFATAGLQLLRGRSLSVSDAGVAVVSLAFANQHFPGTDPMGKRFRFGRPQHRGPWIEIVGVVGNDTRSQLDEMSWVHPPIAYLPVPREGVSGMNVLVRSRDLAWARSVPAVLSELAPDVPQSAIKTMEQLRGEALAYPRFRAALVLVLGFVALALSAAGIYAAVSRNAARRMREFGIRMAVGAHPRSVFGLMLRQGIALLAVGVAAGLVLAWWSSRALASLLFAGVRFDFVTAAMVSLIPVAAGIAAISVPAWRAARLDPMTVLRLE